MPNSPRYELILRKTYYDHGFFNLGVAVDRFIRPDSGPISILLGDSQSELVGEVNREANVNGTPRIMGGVELRSWFQRRYRELDVIDVVILGPDNIWLTSSNSKNP